MSDDANTNALTTKNAAELGKVLLSEAQRLQDEQRQKVVLGEVQRLLAGKEEWKENLARCTAAVDWYTRKLAALEAGQFQVSRAPGLTSAGALIFTESDFNRANY
jgi:hypothetical protein